MSEKRLRRLLLKGLTLAWAMRPSRAFGGDGGKKWRLDGRGVFGNNYIGPIDKPFTELRRAFSGDMPPLLRFPVAAADFARLRDNRKQTTATWIGHATMLLQINGQNILTDPQFSARASPVQFFGPKRGTPPAMTAAQLPPIDIVLISHNHYDHLDSDSIAQLAARFPRAAFFVPLRLKKWFAKFNLANVREYDWWEGSDIGGLKITAAPCQHWSNRGWDKNKTLWASWVIESPDFRCLFIGDTGYSQDFADIRKKFGAFDLAIIPIGAYNPRWFMKEAHQTPEEAVQVFLDLRAAFAVASHWGGFQLTFEPMDEPPRRLARAMRERELDENRFRAFMHGETKFF